MGSRKYEWNDRAEALHRSEDSLVRARVRRRRMRAIAVAALVILACLVLGWELAHALAEGELHEPSPPSPATADPPR